MTTDPREPVEHRTWVDNVDLCWFEWGARSARSPTILLVHATGFHARCWDQTVARLPGEHVIAIDMRGHGRSDDAPPFTWDRFGADLTAFIDSLGLDRLIGVGHSMGGHCVVQAAASRPSMFDALVLVDPVILPPAAYAAWQASAPEDHPVSRRRARFESPDALRAQLEGRGGFAAWLPEVLDDYCRWGLVPANDGDGLVLACPPLVEAAIYTGSAGTDIFDEVRRVECPVTILRAESRPLGEATMDFSKSPTWPDLATRFLNATDVYRPDLTHFIPMQAPALVAGHILHYAGG